MRSFDYESHNIDPDLFLTRKGISDFAAREFGIPIPVSTINKLAARGEGPPTDAIIGTRYLTRVGSAVPWILGRLREPTAA